MDRTSVSVGQLAFGLAFVVIGVTWLLGEAGLPVDAPWLLAVAGLALGVAGLVTVTWSLVR